ncbi:cytochrome P450 [Dendrothele bispora CBS 962.96]|uniref:Cytochrome P450 n=1 Tax=Dendrothele bispora (strain CBS 962.96) TaxID=1314807 RepID=A0A4S8MC85_DENBC|nr:cytochrome P450 [Dendrothele bispora CBS 962.96]
MELSPILLVFPALWILYRAFSTHAKLPLPPGPKGLPFIGSLLQFVRDKKNPKPQWAKYLDMGKTYDSDIVHINVLGDHTIVLNTVKATDELLEKRSAIYSDRPPMYMVNDLCGWDWDPAHLRYSDHWRLHRKLLHQYFQPRAINSYYPFQRKEVSVLLKKLLQSPENLHSHVRHHSGSIILRVSYGITSQEEKDYYVVLANRAIQGLIQAVNHGSFLVDFFPLLKYVPSWVPGAEFKRKAKVWAQYATELREGPWQKLQAATAAGTRVPSCFATENMEKFDSQLEEMGEVIKNCAGIAYLAGSDTTVALVLSTILMLIHHPEVQARAQAELDSVIGTTRLPDFSDRENVPYIEAILNETLRMYPVTPLALPHHSLEDDVYEGYFIPKGSTVVGNAGAILHDPEVYHDPYKFNPDRFLVRNPPPNPALYAFGFGRRICPGRYLALDSAWLVIACILATSTIKKAVDDNGNEIEAVIDYHDGLVWHPQPFKCRFVPRSSEALMLMQTGFENEADVE